MYMFLHALKLGGGDLDNTGQQTQSQPVAFETAMKTEAISYWAWPHSMLSLGKKNLE